MDLRSLLFGSPYLQDRRPGDDFLPDESPSNLLPVWNASSQLPRDARTCDRRPAKERHVAAADTWDEPPSKKQKRQYDADDDWEWTENEARWNSDEHLWKDDKWTDGEGEGEGEEKSIQVEEPEGTPAKEQGDKEIALINDALRSYLQCLYQTQSSAVAPNTGSQLSSLSFPSAYTSEYSGVPKEAQNSDGESDDEKASEWGESFENRRRIVRERKKKEGKKNVSNDVNPATERQLRFKKFRAVTKLRWRLRRADLHDEPDIGGALQLAVQQFGLEEADRKFNKKKSRKRKIKIEGDTADEDSNAQKPGSGNGKSESPKQKTEEFAVEEEDFLTRQLSQLERGLETNDTEETEDDNFEERATFWELGFVAPHNSQVLSLYKESVKSSILRSLENVVTPIEGQTGGTTIPPGEFEHPFLKRKKLHRISYLEYFPVRSRFPFMSQQRHQLFFLHLAARHLVSSCGLLDSQVNHHSTSTNQKLMHVLWKYPLSLGGVARNDIINREALGRSFVLRRFFSETKGIRDRSAQTLGLTTKTMRFRHPIHMTEHVSNKLAVNRIARGLSHIPVANFEQDAMVATTSFVPVPGVEPPCPDFPRPLLPWLWGPPDRNAYNEHTYAMNRRPQGVHILILSALLGQRAAAVDRSNDLDSYDQRVVDMIENVTVQSHQYTKIALFQKHHRFGTAVPSVALFESMMMQMSALANAGLYDWDDTETLQELTEAVYDVFERFIQRPLTRAFPRLSITGGLSLLSRVLPYSAQSILVRYQSDGDRDDRIETPIDIIRRLMESIEEHLDDVPDPESSVARFESEFFRAAELFRSAVEHEPTEPSWHAWYLATLTGCLLLSSGNHMNSGSRRFPSSLKKNASESDDGSSSSNATSEEYLPHEIRPQLNGFHECKRNVARALLLLVSLANQQNGPRAHRILVSHLEWGQAVALLLGDSLSDQVCANIRLLHDHHSQSWAKADTSSPFARQFLRRKKVKRDERLNVLAEELESDPEEVNNWKNLVATLGPIGKIVSTESASGHNRACCPACMSLRDPLLLPGCLASSQSEHPIWLKSRSEFWREDILSSVPPLQKSFVGDPGELMHTVALLLKDLRQLHTGHYSKSDGTEVEQPRAFPKTDWIEAVAETSVNSMKDVSDPSLKERAATYDSDLPVHRNVFLMDSSIGEEYPFGEVHSVHFEGPGGEECLVLSLKAIIAAHMYGPGDSIVTRVLMHFFLQCWAPSQPEKVRTEVPAWGALVWLHSWGINVTYPLESLERKSVLGYTLEMKQAIRDGIFKFGYNFNRIYNDYEVFHSHDPTKVRNCYRHMLKRGEINPPLRNKGQDSRERKQALAQGIKKYGCDWLKIRNSNDAFRDLSHLYVRSLYHQMVLRGEIEPHPDVRTKGGFSTAMKEAVRAGVAKYGPKWTKIRIENKVFDGHPSGKVRHCYRSMVRNGEMEPVVIKQVSGYSPELKDAVREAVQLYGPFWTKIKKEVAFFHKHSVMKIRECYYHMVKKGDMKPVKKGKERFSDEMKEAVRDAVAKHGTSWSKIRDKYAIFHGHPPHKIMNCYRSMVRNGEIEAWVPSVASCSSMSEDLSDGGLDDE